MSPSASRHCAIRSHIATKKITSPAFALTISVFSPNSSDCPVDTNRDNDSATRRASAASGSASMILAATRSVNGFHGNDSTYGATAASTSHACSCDSPASWTIRATLRAFHTRARPSPNAAHNSGCRCRRSNASRTRFCADTTPVPISTPSSAQANSATNGVPAPPTRVARSIPASTGPVDPGTVCSSCRSAQRAASTSSRHSASRSSTCVPATARHAPAASRSATHEMSNMCSILQDITDTRDRESPYPQGKTRARTSSVWDLYPRCRRSHTPTPAYPDRMSLLIVDGANVVGSRPDGWWRDRPGAARRLWEGLAGVDLADEVVLVLEGAARKGVPAGRSGTVDTLHAPGSGDDAIVDAARAKVAEGWDVTVVTADRELRRRVEAVGARTVGPSWLLDQL